MKNPLFGLHLALIATLLACTGATLSAAPTLRVGDSGIVIENGPVKFDMAFPVPVTPAVAKGKISEKTVTANGATLKYEGGGQMEVTVGDGQVIFKPSGMPADVSKFILSMKMGTDGLADGKWQFGSKTGVFPTVQMDGTVYQGEVSSCSMAASSGTGIALTMPSSFQQLQDLRKFQVKSFFWQCWLPYTAGMESITLKVGESSAIAAAPVAETPATGATPEAAPAPAGPPKSVRQGYGQLPGLSPPDKGTGTRIFRWKDGKQAAYLLGFDDSGATGMTTVFPELVKRKMIGNFYVNPGGNAWKKDFALWQEGAKSPYVAIHNHTFLHNGTQSVEEFEADLVKTNEIIYSVTPQLKNPRLLIFRTPGGVPWKITKDETKAVLAKYHMFDRPWLDGSPLTMKALPELLQTVDIALANGQTGFLDFHGIGGDANVTPTEWFMALLDKLDQNRDKIWIASTGSWYQYQAERKNSELKVLESTPTQVRVQLTCTLDPVYFDFPLTLAVEVPAGWKGCTVTRGTETIPAQLNGTEVRFDALPGADEIVIRPQ